ncbi:LysR substrate-binding domain-containing protein [Paenibacillus sp. 23TSA30-6]|uniref:LysR substrate-binding domain-containing protein n=1 Tax=Paenibacillus sp. 23TSA30-6 TaxID=2546104 RepID=UPI001EE250BB|nr:LysR substrate-binding domain-containing protein [Paenibacillus sp. 23TSA30-6]
MPFALNTLVFDSISVRSPIFLLTEKGYTYRTLFDRSIGRRGIDGITSLEFCSAEAIKHCAMTGMGIAFLRDMAVKAELERGELVSLPWEMPIFRSLPRWG